MKLYNLLTKGYKYNNFYELLFSNYLSNDTPTYSEYTGELPVTITCNGEPLVNWILWGNTVQSGTPTPTEPIDVTGVGELETSGEHSGQYKIPILSNSITTPVYLGEVQTERKIKKLVLTGQENWTAASGTEIRTVSYISITDAGDSVCLCSHIEYKSSYSANDRNQILLRNLANRLYIGIDVDIVADLSAFKTWLQQQYAAGTPVTVYYVLATAETATVNEPLQKIGDYADSVANAATIPTNNGSTTISVDTTVQPSEVYIKYIGG